MRLRDKRARNNRYHPTHNSGLGQILILNWPDKRATLTLIDRWAGHFLCSSFDLSIVLGLENIIMTVSALGAKLTIVREVMRGTRRRLLYNGSEKNEIRVYGNTTDSRLKSG